MTRWLIVLLLAGCATHLNPPPPGQTAWYRWQVQAAEMKCFQKQEYPPAGPNPCDFSGLGPTLPDKQ